MEGHRGTRVVAVLLAGMVAGGALALEDRAGCKDHPLLSRMKGYVIVLCQEKAFASHKFHPVGGGPKTAVEGRLTRLDYSLPKGVEGGSGLEKIRNYTQAVEAIGGKVTHEERYSASMTVRVGDQEVWIEVLPGGTRSYKLYILEKQAMKQQVVADAAALLADLDRSGFAVLGGVLFDTDSAVVKAESEPALREIARLLQENPKITAYIVGHTDLQGNLQHNLELSRQRAAAVVEALVKKHGIAARRLEARGVGPLAPVAANANPTGRARNRRVVLVKR